MPSSARALSSSPWAVKAAARTVRNQASCPLTACSVPISSPALAASMALALPPQGSIALDPARVPRIELRYDPFETGEAQQLARP